MPQPIYLPLAVREKCQDLRRYADVVLVVDVSTSMRQQAADGRSKLAAALDAARVLVAAMDLAGQHDRVAVVGFNNTAWTELPLSSDTTAVVDAFDSLAARMQEHTRLDLAVEEATTALGQPGPDRERVVVLLTDGLPNQVPYAEDGTMETTVLRAADKLKATGATVYTIGLGRSDGANPEVNAWLLARVASRADTAFLAPEALDLSPIYHQIAVTIPCGVGPYWPDR